MVARSVGTQLFVKIIPPILNMGVAIGFLSNYGVEIGLGLGSIVVVYTGYNLTTRNKMVALTEDAQKKGFKSFEIASQEIKEYKTVYDFNNLHVAMKKIRDSLTDATEANVVASSLIPKVGIGQAMISGVGYTGLCLLAGRRVVSQQLSASDYAFIGSLAVQFLTPLNGLATAMNQVITSIPAIEAIFDDFEKIPKANDPWPNTPLLVNPENASIKMTNVHFDYDGGLALLSVNEEKKLDQDTMDEAKKNSRPILIERQGKFSIYGNKDKVWQETPLNGLSQDEQNHLKMLFKKSSTRNIIYRAELEGTLLGTILKRGHNQVTTVLKNVSCTIEPGKKIGIVGTSGGGKSTLLNLLMRYYDLVSGEILINGQDISKVGLESLRSAIGIVPQMPVLFNDTLYNNIAYGGLSRPGGVSKEDVEAAVDAACLRGFVNSLPDGLSTMVGEGGAKISGGQRQRIAIARVILKDPSIVILDEATSALDSETEKEIQSNLDDVFHGKTQLVVAHRLGTIKNSDCILVFDQGNIVESGTHQQLLEKNGVYANLQKQKVTEQKEDSNVDAALVVSPKDESSEANAMELKTVSSRVYTNENAPRGYRPTVFKSAPASSVVLDSSVLSKDALDHHIILPGMTTAK
jgi:ABC-type multidrug transport system fused ATPase/permease subunit